MGGLAALIGSLLSWLHGFTLNVCPGSWPWTVSYAGGLLALFPILGAILVALVRKGTGNKYSVGPVVTFASFGLILGLLVPWLIADSTGQVFSSAYNNIPFGLSSGDFSSLHGNVCLLKVTGDQVTYLGSGQTVSQALLHSTDQTLLFSFHLVMLVGLPLLCLLAIMIQQRLALRGGPGWPGRLMWVSFVLLVLAMLPLSANLVSQLWLGFLPVSVLGIPVVALFGRPSWSVLNRQREQRQPPVQPMPRQEPQPLPPPPPPPRQMTPTRIAPVTGPPQPASALANTPGPMPFFAAGPPPAHWGSKDGRFRRIRQLGHGGFGTVWLCLDTQLDRTVALKLAHAPDGETRQRMLREARALAAVHHPNCVRVYDIVEEDGGLGIVMEYIDGKPLSDVVAAGPLDDVAAGRLWSTMAGALADAHAKGVLHRDVKPANVLVDGTGIAHLIDFGIARAKGDATLTAAGMMMGTPDFLAPETASTGNATPASDAWQLAATVSYGLTGQPPRGQRSNPMSAMMAAAQRLPNTHLPERSRHIRLLRLALDADPSRRPTLHTVRKELGAWLSGSGHDENGPVTTIVDTRRL